MTDELIKEAFSLFSAEEREVLMDKANPIRIVARKKIANTEVARFSYLLAKQQ